MFNISKLIILIFLSANIYAIEVDEHSSNIDILSHSSIFIDKTNSLSKKDILNKKFIQNNKKIIGLGFKPNTALWIKFKLKNISNKKLSKTIELSNAITEKVILFDGKNIYTDGMWNMPISRTTLHPIFNISIEPNEEKIFYVKISSKISSLIAQLKLWNNDSYIHYQYEHNTNLFIFFTVIITLLLYNLMIMIFTKDKAYLYYILYLLSLIFFQANYLGIAQLYFFSNEVTILVGKASMIYVSFLIVSIVLFTREFLNIYKFPKLDKVLKIYLYITPFIALISYNNFIFNMNVIGIFIPLGLYVLFISIFSLYKGVKEAKYYVIGWGIVILSLILINLKTLGLFDITKYFQYINELSFSLEAFLFSIALAHRIKTLNEQKNILDAKVINLQNDEKIRLQNLVDEKTKNLQKLLEEKDILYRELNHRVKNNLAMIISLIKLQISNAKNSMTKDELSITKNRINSISNLYENLKFQDMSTDSSTKEYFKNIEDNIRINSNKKINTYYKIECNLKVEQLIYCGLIVNELITNSFKYAFKNMDDGFIEISLKKEKNFFILIVQDNGCGFKNKQEVSLGLTIVKTLVEKQLLGIIYIKSDNGTKITIKWREDD
ncbi:MAG: ATP-binding protein [Thiovulaceae bacterium]|nr:ATP-binding protein [Sulfurimonadaceae bacterium]